MLLQQGNICAGVTHNKLNDSFISFEQSSCNGEAVAGHDYAPAPYGRTHCDCLTVVALRCKGLSADRLNNVYALWRIQGMLDKLIYDGNKQLSLCKP